MSFRIEHDSMGEVAVPADKLWGAQTQRSRDNFQIGVGHETMPEEIIHAFGLLKKAAAIANHRLLPHRMTRQKCDLICQAANEIINGHLSDHFPLVVFQTGSGTQSNMNANEVIANFIQQKRGSSLIHPNDDVNMSQSSNDTFPTAMHIAAYIACNKLLDALSALIDTFRSLEEANRGIIKSGRTHLQDATPIGFDQEISGWRTSLEQDRRLIMLAQSPLRELALGGTAVGTGINAPPEFGCLAAQILSQLTDLPFITAPNKFHALTSKDELVFAHGAIKAAACDLLKIANDIRWLASGPRNGLGEITIPSNEPGSSIMPGKVNPTQCEALTMVSIQIMGNDTAISFAASQGNFELNVFMPLIAYNFLQSARLLSDAVTSFNTHCVSGILPNRSRMDETLRRSLMTVTALNPLIGYEKAALVAKKAFDESISLREACLSLGFLSPDEFDSAFRFEKML